MSHRRAKERFTGRVESYVRYRPTYPRGVVDALLARAHLRENDPVADIGSGTGIFARLLLDRGLRVYAIEPNSAMRHEAEAALSRHARFSAIAGEATATTLQHGSVKAVTVAQAFHWFAEELTVREFARILAPEGLVLLLWNDRSVDADEFHKEYEQLLQDHCPEYADVDHRRITSETIRRLFPDWQCERKVYENNQTLDWETLCGRLESASYCPPSGAPEHDLLFGKLRTVFSALSRDGVIAMHYNCVAYFLLRTPAQDG